MEYDYVVVGAGAAGCVIARRLSEDFNSRVLLLEAGPATGPAAMSVPSAWVGLLGSEVDWAFSTIPQNGTDGRVHLWPRGRVLGGSTSINGMAFVRGDRSPYDAWEKLGAMGWSYEDLLPYFKRSEKTYGRDPNFRGTEGPLNVSPAASRHPVTEAFFEAASDAGIPLTDDLSGPSPEGVGWYDMNMVDGVRQSAADAYLQSHDDLPNLTVATGALVRKLVMDGTLCTGVIYQVGGRQQQARATREVILTAGTIGSAHLLLLSGIGPASHLRDRGVEVVVDLPGVGENLQDHLQVPVIYAASQPVPAGQANHAGNLALLRIPPGSAHSTVMIYPVDLPFSPGGGDLPDNGYTIMTVLSRPHSKGTLRLATSALSQPPLLDPKYLSDERDMDTLLSALRVARRLGESSALAAWRRAEILPGPDTQFEGQWQAHVRRTAGTQFHPVGTCRMGTDSLAVVDPELRVCGVQGLRVADASVMPVIPSTNIIAAVYAIAERAADLIRHAASTEKPSPR